MDFIDSFEKMFGIVAVVVAGLWVVWKYFLGRFFIPRLQVDLESKLISKDDSQYILVHMKAKNIGSKIVKIGEDGTTLVVYSLRAKKDVSEVRTLKTEDITGFSAFPFGKEKIKKIEPGTTLCVQKIIEIPEGKYDFFKLEFIVYALRGWIVKHRLWRAIAIAR